MTGFLLRTIRGDSMCLSGVWMAHLLKYVSGGIRPDEADYLVGFGVSGLLGGQTEGKE